MLGSAPRLSGGKESMSARPITMRKLKELMRLKFEARLTHRQVGRSLGISPGTVSSYVHKCHEAGLGWPLPEGLNEEELEARLFAEPLHRGRSAEKVEPDFALMHQELKRKGVTLQLLLEEYREGLASLSR